MTTTVTVVDPQTDLSTDKPGDVPDPMPATDTLVLVTVPITADPV